MSRSIRLNYAFFVMMSGLFFLPQSGSSFYKKADIYTDNIRTGDICQINNNHQHIIDAEGEYCPMHGNMTESEHVAMVAGHDHAAHNTAQDVVSSMVQPQGPERPDGSRDTESHRWSPGDGCSRRDPNAENRNRDGVKPNTVACTCVKQCVNGNTQEDLRKEDGKYICRNASHRDRCFCPDPCKS